MKRLQLFIKSLIGTMVFLLILFISAGRINYWQGWLYATISILSLFMNSFYPRNSDELAEERLSAKTGAKSWDKRIVGLSALILVITYITAGLDSGRFHWSSEYHWSFHAIGVLLICAGAFIFLAAQKENRFFSSLVRIQTDRGHTVCDTGIYSFVRHPGYLGNIITAAGIPLVLGSLWSYIPSFTAVILIIIRTSAEDKTLTKELEGYSDYAKKTRCRLFPGVW